MSRSRLAPGVEVVAVPGRGLAVRTPEGEFLSVRTGEADERLLLSRLSGETTVPADAEVDRVVRGFEQADFLADDSQPAAWPAGRRNVRLIGDAALTRPLAAQLAALGAEPHITAGRFPSGADDSTLIEGGSPSGADDLPSTAGTSSTASASPSGADGPPTTPGSAPWGVDDLLGTAPAAVVWCLDGPVPDGLWDDADRLPEHGVAWLRCHREGWQAYVEPLAAEPGDVTSAHLRSRRLAATPAHRELAAYWHGPRTCGRPARLTLPAATLLAALLADDLHRWATGTPATAGLPARRRLRQVDLRTLTVTEHPVLPVPAVAPMPKKAG
ncbi:hypothetical protein ACFVOR_28990 [Streptomyces sp. NPDC057837]|uniref:hypothetical protein n=1 Tax=Streptomyces sp. NPDC057837 TaxID=3346260 RepID=UPI0036A5C66F